MQHLSNIVVDHGTIDTLLFQIPITRYQHIPITIVALLNTHHNRSTCLHPLRGVTYLAREIGHHAKRSLACIRYQ